MAEKGDLPQVITTADGSPSLFMPDSEETYHSRHGALTESLHVFIQSGLEKKAVSKTEIRMLEVGLGTGLNAALAASYASEKKLKLHYVAVEPKPVSESLVRDILESWSSFPDVKELLVKIHSAEWNKDILLHDHFNLTKQECDLQSLHPSVGKIDLVFFDAFSPRVQPELWTEEIFRGLFARMNPGGILVTYCAKGEVRRAMISAGFSVERLPGPPGKREMLRARRLD